VHKDEGGYGLTLSGDKPTRVQTVRVGGASHRAGVREGDVIIKVNGQQVTESSHGEVVKLIQTGSYVALTVVHSSRFTALQSVWGGVGSVRDLREEPEQGASGVERRESCRSPGDITGPSPPNNDAEKKFFTDKVHTFQLMVEQQTRVVEELRSSLARTNSKKIRTKLEAAVRSLQELETQSANIKQGSSPERGDGGGRGSSLPTSPSGPLSPFIPVAPPRSDSMCLPLTTGLPPPLPARNNKVDSPSDPAPLPPPRNLSNASLPPPPPNKFPRHNSHENLQPRDHPPPPHPPPLQRRGSQVTPPSPSPRPIEHTRTRSSPVSLEKTLEIAKKFDQSGRKSPRYETPPGTPPPPYISELVTWGNVTRPDIITMEDDSDDGLEEEGGEVLNRDRQNTLPPEGDHGPFNSLQELLQHAAHLAVFLNYVISNSDPCPLLFYMITDAYKLGSAKEMRKWAYEIHSCFLVPRSPLELPNLDSGVIHHIDKFLAEENSELREESLLKLFWKVRSRARDILKVQLDDFRAKRAAGLGNIFGPSDPELKLCDDNNEKKMSVINDRLVPMLETMGEDLENATDRNSTLCASLATVMSKIFVTKCPKALSIIEKIPTFVSKEKRKEKFLGRVLEKKKTVLGHNFVLKHYDQVTYCNHSQVIIWGIGPQGYQCTNCNFDVHKKFVHKIEESCVGPSHDKKKRNRTSILSMGLASRLSDVGRIMSKDQLQILEPGRKPSVSPSPSMRGPNDLSSSFQSYTNPNDTSHDDQPDASRQSLEPEARPLSLLESSAIKIGDIPIRSPSSISDNSHNRTDIKSGKYSPKSAGVKRSESAKDGEHRKNPRRGGVRKHSDPNLGPSRSQARLSLDAETVSKSGSSSSSSIAEIRLWEATSVGSTSRSDLQRADSDLEAEQADPPDWRNSLTPEQMANLSSKEAKRQDVINELFHTERSHVRNLKVLDRVFRRPLLESGLMPKEVVDRLFPNIEEVLAVHSSYNNAMKNLVKGGFPIGNIGELLGDMFLGSFGDRLISVGAEFTKNQKFTIEELKRIRQRDSRVEQKLAELEANPACRRLQLQSILPVEHQRLVKYPLLLEQISKHCAVEEADSGEMELMKDSTARTKEILDSIDKQVAEAQNKRKLEDVQRNLDTSGLEKMGPDNSVNMEYRNVELTRFKLHHDGLLTLNLGGENKRTKNIELHVLLMEDCVMFLQRQDEKYLLKFHTGSNSIVPGGTRDEVKKIHSPVIKFNTMLVRPVATNKRAFYLMNTTQVGAQLYELVANSTNERSTWLSHISEASAAFKAREHRFRPTNSTSNISFVQNRQQIFENNSDPDRKSAATGRSQSFNEQSLRQREILSRPLPSPPIEREVVETLEKKIEKLTKKDEEVARALEEKQKIIADIFNIPPEDYDAITDLVANTDDRKDAKDVLLAVMSQADNLARCVNDCLKVSDGEVGTGRDLLDAGDRGMRLATPPSDKLVTITTNMNTNLTALLVIIQEQEEEKQRWRRELLASQEQVRAFVTGGSDSCHSFRSRPDSFISLESDLNSEQEDKSEIQESVDTEDAIGEEAAPSSSTPLKDATPTNEVPSDSLENSIENDSLENIVVDETSVDVQLVGEISDVGEIVESSDC